MTGTLTCTTTAVDASPVGAYPISELQRARRRRLQRRLRLRGRELHGDEGAADRDADNKSRLFGPANPPLTATLSGFVLGQTLATSGVTGTASCTTTAMPFSPAGNYPITCTAGDAGLGELQLRPVRARHAHGHATRSRASPGLASGRSRSPRARRSASARARMVSGPMTVEPRRRARHRGRDDRRPVRSTGAAVVRICGAHVSRPAHGHRQHRPRARRRRCGDRPVRRQHDHRPGQHDRQHAAASSSTATPSSARSRSPATPARCRRRTPARCTHRQHRHRQEKIQSSDDAEGSGNGPLHSPSSDEATRAGGDGPGRVLGYAALAAARSVASLRRKGRAHLLGRLALRSEPAPVVEERTAWSGRAPVGRRPVQSRSRPGATFVGVACRSRRRCR